MGWAETCAMDERMRFVLAVEEGRGDDGGVVPALRGEPSERLQVAGAATGRRGRRGCSTARARRSRVAQEVSAAVAERCLAVRRAHPSWGPVKVRAFLQRREPEMRLAGGEHDRGACSTAKG